LPHFVTPLPPILIKDLSAGFPLNFRAWNAYNFDSKTPSPLSPPSQIRSSSLSVFLSKSFLGPLFLSREWPPLFCSPISSRLSALLQSHSPSPSVFLLNCTIPPPPLVEAEFLGNVSTASPFSFLHVVNVPSCPAVDV